MPRFDAPEPYRGNFVEYSGVWTVGERRKYFEMEGEEYIALLRRKITALHIDTVDGKPITTTEDLVAERYDEVDGNLWEWFRGTPMAALMEVTTLGKTMRLQLFNTAETTASALPPAS